MTIEEFNEIESKWSMVSDILFEVVRNIAEMPQSLVFDYHMW